MDEKYLASHSLSSESSMRGRRYLSFLVSAVQFSVVHAETQRSVLFFLHERLAMTIGYCWAVYHYLEAFLQLEY